MFDLLNLFLYPYPFINYGWIEDFYFFVYRSREINPEWIAALIALGALIATVKVAKLNREHILNKEIYFRQQKSALDIIEKIYIIKKTLDSISDHTHSSEASALRTLYPESFRKNLIEVVKKKETPPELLANLVANIQVFFKSEVLNSYKDYGTAVKEITAMETEMFVNNNYSPENYQKLAQIKKNLLEKESELVGHILKTLNTVKNKI